MCPPPTSCLFLCSRQITALALPALLSLLVDPILSLVDTAYVGRGLGSISLAALGESDGMKNDRAEMPAGALGNTLTMVVAYSAGHLLRGAIVLIPHEGPKKHLRVLLCYVYTPYFDLITMFRDLVLGKASTKKG